MVDHKSGTYRPRRALIEPNEEPAQAERPARPGPDGNAHNGNGHNGNGHSNGRGTGNGTGNGRGFAEPVERRSSTSSARTPRPEPVEGSPWTSSAPSRLGPLVDDGQPKPLYREEAPFSGPSRSVSRARMPADQPTQETLMTPATLAPRRPPSGDDETTTILPRSRPTKSLTQALDAIDDYDDDERRPLGQGAKLALIIGSVAVVVVIGLLIGYAVRGAANPRQPQPTVSQPSGGGGLKDGNQPPGQTSNALLSDASMLSPKQAKLLDPNRSWTVVTTEQGATGDSPTAACFGGEPPEGQPTPQQKFVRVLKSGKTTPSVLHVATAYNSPDDAALAYQIASKTLGGCAIPGYWIRSGRLVSGIGNQAAGAVIMEKINGKGWRAHSVVLNLTGQVVNVLDAVQPSHAIAGDAVAEALGQVNKAQCATAGGECGGKPSISKGPPPLGGDPPGFLAKGDLPPAGPKIYPWIAADVEAPDKEFAGSGCESVKWATEPAKSRSWREYLIQESGKNFFGLNEITLTTKDTKAAKKLVGRIKADLSKCRSVHLTARVTNVKKVSGVGVEKTKITGWAAVVTQKSTGGWVKYRVGVVSAGSKVIYTFLNPAEDYDFTNRQWEIVAVRAGERSTQVS